MLLADLPFILLAPVDSGPLVGPPSVSPSPSVVVALTAIAGAGAPLVLSDVRSHRLPNRLVAVAAAGVLVGLGGSVASDIPSLPAVASDALAVFGAGAIAFVVFVGLRMLGAVGMGDAKLAAVLAGALGLVQPRPAALAGALLVAAAVAFVSAGAVAVVGPLVRSTLQTAGRSAPDRRIIPFGPFLLLGFWAAVLMCAASPVSPTG